MYRDIKRHQAFIGAIIGAATSIASGIAGMVKKRKQQRIQARQEKAQQALQTAQQTTQAMNNQLASMSEYRDNFMDTMMKCGGKVKKKCGGKKSLGGEGIGNLIGGAGSLIGGGLNIAASNTAGATAAFSQGATNIIKGGSQIHQNRLAKQETQMSAPVAKTPSQVAGLADTGGLKPGTISNNLIGEAVGARYGGRRKHYACGGKKACGGTSKKTCGGSSKK